MDATRAIAAIAVVASHARDLVVSDYQGQIAWSGFYLLTGLGRQAVIVFFVISGFWIGKSVLEGAANSHFWRDYLINRLSRLYIVLIPALCLGGLLDAVGHHQLGLPVYTFSEAHSMRDVSVASLTVPNFFGNALYLQSILVPVFGTNGPLWSLAYEFWFYIWFPALFLLRSRRFSILLISLALVWFAPMLAAYFAIWLIGVAVFFLNRVLDKPAANRTAALATLPALVVAVILFALGVAGSSIDGSYLAEFALALSFGLLLLLLLRLDVRLWSPPGWLARFGSRSSFSVYIVHFPILVLAFGLARADRLQIGAVSASWVVLLTGFAVAGGWAFSLLTEAHTKRLQKYIYGQFTPREK